MTVKDKQAFEDSSPVKTNNNGYIIAALLGGFFLLCIVVVVILWITGVIKTTKSDNPPIGGSGSNRNNSSSGSGSNRNNSSSDSGSNSNNSSSGSGSNSNNSSSGSGTTAPATDPATDPATEPVYDTTLKYGDIIHIRNFHDSTPTYLDTCGRPDRCPKNTYNVSTSETNKRSNGKTGSWVILKKDDISSRDKLKYGEKVFIKNLADDGTYLVTCDRPTICKSGSSLAVSTIIGPPQDSAGIWELTAMSFPAKKQDIKDNTKLYIKNLYEGSYLDACGNVSICSSVNKHAVSTNTSFNRLGGTSGTWALVKSIEYNTIDDK
jgi:hypothetical protein